jgi:5'-3' exoribonuclease 1
MGIPSYFSHIIKEHGEILKKYCQSSIDNLYLDSNSIIYDVVNDMKPSNITKDELEENIIKMVCLKIKEYIDKLQPTKTIFIAFDGVAPIAKLSQQRNRRVKTSFQNELLREMGIEKNKLNWETTSITPGTEFMNKLDKKVKKVFDNFDDKNVIISTSIEPGEGEHKIFNYIKQNPAYHKDTVTVIYGLDADLIMLSLNHLHITSSLFLYRETPHFIKSINRDLEPNMEYLLDISLFSERLKSSLVDNNRENTTKNNTTVIFDYIFMFFLLGNDFLPHFPALNIRTDGIQRIIDCYNSIQKNGKKINFINVKYSNDNNVSDTNIVWRNVRELIGLMSKYEEDYLNIEMAKREKMTKHIEKKLQNNNDDTTEERLLMIPVLDRTAEEYIDINKIGWENRYYKLLFDINIDSSENNYLLKNICINYLEGVEWTWKYYTHGCIDWEWKYNYHYPPLLKDLIKYIPYFDTNLLSVKEIRPVHPYVQLAYVLPKSSLYLLPEKIERELIEKHTDWYNFSNKFVWAYCKYFWECHCELPYIDIKLLEEIINENT